MSLKAAAAGGMVWTSVERWGQQALGLVVFTLLARLLDKEAFGLVALAGVYVAFVQMFATQGLGAAIVQRKELKPSHLDAAFWVSVVTALVLAALTVMFRGPLAVILESERIGPVLAWLAIDVPLMALSIVPGALLTREMKFKALARRTLVGTIVGGAVGVASAFLGFGVWSLVAQQLVGAAVSVVCLWFSVGWRPGVRADRRAFADLSAFSVGMLVNNVLWFISQRVDQAVIGTGLGVAALGAYSIAQKVVSMGLDALISPAQRVAMPAFSRMQADVSLLGRTFVRSTCLVCALALPAFLGTLLIGPRLIPAVFGTKWDAAVIPMQILCVAGIFRAVQTFVDPTFLALGRVRLYTWLFALYASLSGVGCWLAATHGMAAVAWAMVVAAGGTGVANFFVVSRLVRIPFGGLYAGMWPILVACGIMGLSVFGTERVLSGRVHELIVLVTQVVIGMVCYGTAVAVLARELWDELWSIAKLMRGQTQAVQPPA